jgi:hypothetical protein
LALKQEKKGSGQTSSLSKEGRKNNKRATASLPRPLCCITKLIIKRAAVITLLNLMEET